MPASPSSRELGSPFLGSTGQAGLLGSPHTRHRLVYVLGTPDDPSWPCPGAPQPPCTSPWPPVPFFFGPRHTTASSGCSSRKPTDISESRCSTSTYTGSQLPSHWCTAWPCTCSMRGMLGPHRSTSRSPTYGGRAVRGVCVWLHEGPRGEAPWGPCTFLPAWHRASASSAETVLFPTPPFPERMRMTRGLPARPPSSGGKRG